MERDGERNRGTAMMRKLGWLAPILVSLSAFTTVFLIIKTVPLLIDEENHVTLETDDGGVADVAIEYLSDGVWKQASCKPYSEFGGIYRCDIGSGITRLRLLNLVTKNVKEGRQ